MKKISIAMLLFISLILMAQSQIKNSIEITVDANKVTHQMKGGIGASWHALIHDIPLENDKYDYPVRHINPRGSAYAGNCLLYTSRRG